jgi:hypothetical protein
VLANEHCRASAVILRRMALNAHSTVSMPAQDEGSGNTEPSLSLRDYNVSGGSIRCKQDEIKFAITIWTLPEATVAMLEAVALKRGRIRLLLPHPVLLDLVAVERNERQLRITGRVLGSTSIGSDMDSGRNRARAA